MTRALQVRDATGKNVRGWKFRSFKNVTLVHDGPRRQISGWTLIDPEGYERNIEGNWLAFVPYVRIVIANHGLSCEIS